MAIFTVKQVMEFFAKNPKLISATIEMMYTEGSKIAENYMRFNGHMSDEFASVIMAEIKYRLGWLS
jgi:hypothetical protein